MLFGNKNFFAIELKLSQYPNREWMIGYINYYISGNEIGDIGFTTTLRDVMIELQSFLISPEDRIHKNLFQKDYYEIFSLITNGLQEEICSGADGMFGEQYNSYPGEFIITPRVDVMDDWTIFMVSSGDFDKIVCQHRKTKDFGKMVCQPSKTEDYYTGCFERGIVDRVMMEALLYLEKIYRSFVGSDMIYDRRY